MAKTKATSSSSSRTTKSTESDPLKESKRSKELRHEEQRLRNIDSAKRSRERLKFEDKWMQVQTMETSDRIGRLEREVKELSSQVGDSSRRRRQSKHQCNEERPAWFGQPF